MSEQDWSAARRRWRASGDPEDWLRVLRLQERGGEPTGGLLVKLSYYGKPLAGKSTNFEQLRKLLQPRPGLALGELTSIATEGGRTLFFDIRGRLFEVLPLTVQVYTTPGSVYYENTRELALKGSSAIAFVVDSQAELLDWNLDLQTRLAPRLRGAGLDPDAVPRVYQWNKRDLGRATAAASIDELERLFNPEGHPAFPAVATRGEGVLETFTALLGAGLTPLFPERTRAIAATLDFLGEAPG